MFKFKAREGQDPRFEGCTEILVTLFRHRLDIFMTVMLKMYRLIRCCVATMF